MAKMFDKRDIVGGFLAMVVIGLVAVALLLAKPRNGAPSEPDIDTKLFAEADIEISEDSLRLRPFDPNTVEYEQLRAMGIDRKVAVSLVKYRAAGKVFRIREDVALCYGISDSLYDVLKPYITIGEEYRIKPRKEYSSTTFDGKHQSKPKPKTLELKPFKIDTVTVDYLRATGLFTKRQAEVVIRWRDRSGFRDMAELRECYVVDDEVATALEPYVIFPEPEVVESVTIVELNSADSVTLRSIVGIGERSVEAIVRYRELLGGYHSVEQLRELDVITPDNYLRIKSQVWCNTQLVRRMDLNIISVDMLAAHPYVSQKLLRRVMSHRSKGKQFESLDDLVSSRVISEDEAKRLAPYLLFAE